MHYFDFNIKSYHARTEHLTDDEDLAYRRVMEVYYDTELPIPDDMELIARKIRMASKVTAVTTIIREFFFLQGDGWHQDTCDRLIKKWKSRKWFPRDPDAVFFRLPIDQWKITRLRIFERDGFTCLYCFKKGGKLECDHIIPISRGGSNDDSNLITSCFKCNRSKGGLTAEEFKSRCQS